VEDLCKPTKEKGSAVHVHQIRVRPNWMEPIMLFLKDDVLPESKSEADKIRRKAHRFWLSEDQNLYKRSFSAHTCYAYTLKQLSCSWKNYMKGFVEVTRGADLYLTGPSHKFIGGRRNEHMNM